MMGWQIISIGVAVVSAAIGVLTSIGYRTARSVLAEVSNRAHRTLVDAYKAFHESDAVIQLQPEGDRPTADAVALLKAARLDLERSIRRLTLYTRDRELVRQSVMWFEVASISADREHLQRALQLRLIRSKEAKQMARRIVQRLAAPCFDNGR